MLFNHIHWSFPGGLAVKNLPSNVGDTGLIPEWGRSSCRREWLPTPVFLPGESHRQRSPTTERLSTASRLGENTFP